MKSILITTLSVVGMLPALAAQTPISEPKLVVFATASGEVSDGFKAFQQVQLPRKMKITPMPQATTGEVEVQILHFNFDELPIGEFLDCFYEELDPCALLQMIDAAGFRPAKIEEMLAVRPQLSKIDRDVSVYGNSVWMDGMEYNFILKFHYILGTDIMGTVDGARVGILPADWRFARFSVYIAAVKK